MKSVFKKNLFIRQSIFKLEKKKKIYRYLLSNNKIFLHIRWQCFLNIVKLNSISNATTAKNFCYITKKTKIFSKTFRMSRFNLRRHLVGGKIFNSFS
jgi:hypothetical protein